MASIANHTPSADLGKKRILVAEAESRTGFSISRYLTEQGFETKSVQTLEEAVQVLRRAAVSYLPYHAMMIDETVPVDKIGNLESVRKGSGTQALKVILVSSAGSSLTRVGVDVVIQPPLVESKVMTALREAFEPKAAKTSPEQTIHRRILVVEDDSLSQELLKIVLTKNGHRVQLASNGAEAIEACEREPFDLVFMDLQMPGIDGFVAAQRIHELNASTRGIPIVALTASNISSKAYEKLDSEFARVLTKPFEIPSLLRTIRECTTSAMDIHEALPHFGLDPEQYRQIFGEFLASLPARLADLDQSLRAGDLAALARGAHNLKGVSANVGAMRLSLIAARLDDQCDAQDAAVIAQTFGELTAAADYVQTHAQQTIDEFFAIPSFTDTRE
jgi:CheY-like chemotaxis protein